MLPLLFAATLLDPDHRQPRREEGRATAAALVTIRIISGARVHLGRSSDDPAALIHDAAVHFDGVVQPANLVEFQ